MKQNFALPSSTIKYIHKKPKPRCAALLKLYKTCKYFYPSRLIFNLKNSVIQSFALPSPIIRYIYQNPIPNPICLLKLYSLCKFFYARMKIVYLDNLAFMHFSANVKLYWTYPRRTLLLRQSQMFSINFKLLCTDTIFNICGNSREEDGGNSRKLVSFLITKFWYIRNCAFCIKEQIITLKEYEKLAEVSCSLILSNVTILKPDGSLPFVEDLLSMGIYIRNFTFSPKPEHSGYYSSQTAQKLASVLLPTKFKRLRLKIVPPTFDAASFLTFIVNNFDHFCHSDLELNFWNTPKETCDIFCKNFIDNLKETPLPNMEMNVICSI